ncbi:MAG: helix-turn-helix domain-containing protein, partial [Pseudomonadota bacterium]|nr:helix-turn-helix domain-containing protein [Pseudomonadota bacterium]
MRQDPAKIETKQGLLLAAERLFALQGFAATTIRQINAAAGQKNQSAIHYHFGSRDGILDAILDQRVPPMNAARAALLARMRAEAGTAPLTSTAIVTALIQPNVDRLMATPGPHFTARLLLQMRVDHDVWRRYAKVRRAWSLDDIRAEIVRAQPFAPPEALQSRFRQAVNLSMFQVGEIERAQDQLGPG